MHTSPAPADVRSGNRECKKNYAAPSSLRSQFLCWLLVLVYFVIVAEDDSDLVLSTGRSGAEGRKGEPDGAGESADRGCPGAAYPHLPRRPTP